MDWLEVASNLPGRSNKDCRKRWKYVLEKNIRKGSWTPEEDGRLREAFKQHGMRYAGTRGVPITRISMHSHLTFHADGLWLRETSRRVRLIVSLY